MSTSRPTQSAHALTISRTLAAPRLAVWRCWMEPELLVQWFCPKPWQVTQVDMEPRAGGRFFTLMQGPGPDGQLVQHRNPGVFLEVVEGKRLVFTDAFESGWIPTGYNCVNPQATEAYPFMVATVEFAESPEGGTFYKAEARHWSAADRTQHEQMGFHEGWGVCADQLEALARTL